MSSIFQIFRCSEGSDGEFYASKMVFETVVKADVKAHWKTLDHHFPNYYMAFETRITKKGKKLVTDEIFLD